MRTDGASIWRALEAVLDRATVDVVREQVDLGIETATASEIRREAL